MRIIGVVLLLSLISCAVVEPASIDAQADAAKLIDQGTLALRSGKLDEAESAFQVSLELFESAAALDGLGCVAMLRGNAAQAEQKFIAAYSLDTDYTVALGNLALLYDVAGFKSESALLFEQAILSDPRNFRARNNLAVLLTDRPQTTRDLVRAKSQLGQAKAIAAHPIIEKNLMILEEEI